MDSNVVEEKSFTEDDLTQMVLRLAHEIRNPLATIQSAVQLIEHRHQPDVELLEFYQDVYREITRINRVIHDMQQFARLDIHTATTVRIGDAVAAAIEGQAAYALERQCKVLTKESPPAEVLMDAHQLDTALSELIKNAISFSGENTKVKVAWCILYDELVAIHIEDEGPGISKSCEANILRPFYSNSTQGTGLGLNIVSRVANLVGGRLEWCNLEKRGARFTLVLPMASDSHTD